MKNCFTFLFAMLLMAPVSVQAVSVDLFIGGAVGYSQFDGDEDAPGAQGEDGVRSVTYSAMAATGINLAGRWTLEASYLDHDFIPGFDIFFMGVRGTAQRYLLGYRHPVNDVLQVGVRGGVLVWEHEIRPFAVSGTEWETHSGVNPYGGVFLRLGSEQGGWLVGYDYSDLDGLEYHLIWTGFELARRVWG